MDNRVLNMLKAARAIVPVIGDEYALTGYEIISAGASAAIVTHLTWLYEGRFESKHTPLKGWERVREVLEDEELDDLFKDEIEERKEVGSYLLEALKSFTKAHGLTLEGVADSHCMGYVGQETYTCRVRIKSEFGEFTIGLLDEELTCEPDSAAHYCAEELGLDEQSVVIE